MLKGEPNNIKNKDVQYLATSEEVEAQEVFSIFKNLQVPGEVIDIDDKGGAKGDDDDDDTPSSKGTPRQDTTQERSKPSSNPPAKEPKETSQKGKGATQDREKDLTQPRKKLYYK